MKRALLMLILLLTASAALAQTFPGSWELYPAQTQTYQVSVQQPINPDGTSVWSANKGVVPVQFTLSKAYGPVLFESLQNAELNCVGTSGFDCSYLFFYPESATTFSQITNLTAVYTFTTGNCAGGSLRWEIGFTDKTVLYIYYGEVPSFTECKTPNQSGTNLLTLTDARFQTTSWGGPYYGTYADALGLSGSRQISYIVLALDGGWSTSQAVTLGNVTVNNNTFQPLTGSAPTCDLPPATIQVTRLNSQTPGVDEQAIQQNADFGDSFRVIDCKYI